ncbi:MAG: Crp/Fnr family transcriptional regulator [Gemmatimonadota bacterium]
MKTAVAAPAGRSRRRAAPPTFLLAESALPGGASGGDRRRLSRLFERRRYSRGAAIFARGDPGDSLCVVTSGLVKLQSGSRGGPKTLLRILKPGDVFGELLFSGKARAFTAVAATDVTVDAISRGDLGRLLLTRPRVARDFILLLSRRLAAVERSVAEFGHTWSYHRLATVLLRLAEEHGLQSPSGILIPFALTHAELGDMIGTTRETVTAQLVRFRRLGLVRREGRRYVVDRRRLLEFIRSAKPPFRAAPVRAAV